MSEISMYEAQKKKMEGLCEEHDLTYAYIVTPVSASLTAWGDAGVKVGDITENGKMPFTCTDTPTSAISVNILRAEVSQ